MSLDPIEIARSLQFESRYEIRRRLGRRGPDECYEVFDRVLERDITLKMAGPNKDLDGLLRTAKLAGALRHPNFLPVYDLGVIDGGTPFYTTAAIREVPLDCLLRGFEGDVPSEKAKFPIVPLAGAVRDACRALDFAHRRGLLHLDIHPGSLLVGDDYHVFLDAERWTEIAEVARVSSGGRFVGHLSYVSPEQVDWEGPATSPATDVFGLGGVLHFVLFGTAPNRLAGSGGVRELVAAIAGKAFEPRRPGTLRPGLRSAATGSIDGLVDICMKALSYEPEARYPSAAEMGEAIEAWIVRAERRRLRWPRRR